MRPAAGRLRCAAERDSLAGFQPCPAKRKWREERSRKRASSRAFAKERRSRAHLRVACPETFGRVTELHHRASSAAALVCRWSLPLITTGKRWLITATRFT